MMYVKIDKKIFASIILLFFLLMSIYNIKAEEEKYKLIFKTGEPALIRVPCFNEGNYCSDAAVCKITIIYKNDVLVKDEIMQNEGAFHTYNFTNTSRPGEYITTVVCEDSSSYGFSTFSFEINPVGEKGSGFAGYLLIIFVIFALFFFIMSRITKNYGFEFLFLFFGFVFLILSFYLLVTAPQLYYYTGIMKALYVGAIYLFAFFILIFFVYIMFAIIQWNKYRKKMKKFEPLEPI